MIELKDVIKIYKQETDSLFIPALRGINLSIEKGKIVVLIGPSGSGKSTLIKLLAGFDKPSSGEIKVDDIGRIDQLQGRKLEYYHREILGFVFQYPQMNLMDHLSVFDNIMYPLRISGKFNKRECVKRVDQLLQILNLENKKHAKSSTLSGGEALRVSFAVALANNPSLVIADEPTGELDSENTSNIINHIKSVNEKFNSLDCFFNYFFISGTNDEKFTKIANQTYKIKDGYIQDVTHKIKSLNTSNENEIFTITKEDKLFNLPPELREIIENEGQINMKYDKEKHSFEIVHYKV